MGQIHVILGTDDLLVAEAAKKVVGDGVGLEVIDSNTSTNEEKRLRDIGEVELSYRTPPFLDPKKVTWWKNVRFLPGGTEKSSEAVKETLDRFAKNLAATKFSENHHFLLTGPKWLKTSLFAKTLGSVAEVIVFEQLKPWEAAKRAVPRAIEMAAERRLVFAPGAAEAFVQKVGNDTRSLMNELDKLDLYLGADDASVGARGRTQVSPERSELNARCAPQPRAITSEAIEAVVSPGIGVEPEIWAIAEALGNRKRGAVLAAAMKFAGEGNFAVLVTSVAERFFREMAALKDAEEHGKLQEATAAMPPWQANRMRTALAHWRTVELRNAQRMFMKLREMAVSSSGDSVDALVTVTLARVCT